MSLLTSIAGTSSPDVLSVQGIAGAVAIPVSMAAVPTGGATAALQTVANEQLQGIVDALVTTGTSYNWLFGNGINANVMKASAGLLFALNCNNTHSSNWMYVKLYNKSTAPDPAGGVDVPVATLAVPPASKTHLQIPTSGLSFSSGIAWAVVTGAAHANATGVATGEGILFAVYA